MTAPTLTTKLDRESAEANLLDIGGRTNESGRIQIGRKLTGAAE